MKNLLLLGILFCLSWPPLQAQTQQEVSLNGCITDTHLLPIDYATIVLQKEGHQITGAITDSEGCFTLFAEAGDYTLIIQCLGYDSIHTRVSIPTSTPLAYQLKPAAFAIKEVVVKANSIEREADRFIMTVQPMSGKDGTELLLDAPGVWLTEDNISINGSSGTKVYVNEREIKLSGEELIVYLRTLKAENIRRIEVIPIAGAEYEAGTRSGVVKITLRQQQIDGYQGTLSAGAIFGKHFQRYQPTGSLQLRMQKWVINASGSGTFTPNDKGQTDSERNYYQPGQSFADQTQSNTKGRYGTGRLGVIFEADSLNSFGGEIEYINRHTNEHSLNQTQFMIAEQTLLSDADNRLRNQNSTLSATANYVRKTDDLGSVLKAIVDYNTKCSTGDNDYHTMQQTAVANRDSVYRYHSRGNYDMLIGELSFLKIFKPTLKLNSGLKYTNTSMRSHSGYQAWYEQEWIEKPTYDEHIRYKEHIAGAFVSATASLKKWDFTGGLRLEYTHTADLTGHIKRDYVDLFPNLNVSYAFDDFKRWMLIGQLGRSIERPAFYALNPNRVQLSDYSYSIGNPYLKPMYVDRFGATLVFNYRYILSIGGNLQHDLIREYVKQDPTDPNVSFLTYENHFKENHWFVYLSAPFQPMNWLTLTFDFTGVKQDIKMTKESSFQKHYLAFTNATAAFTLPAGFSAEVRYNGMSRLYSGNCEVSPLHTLNLFVRKRCMNNRLLLTAQINNLFDRQYRFINSMEDYRVDIGTQKGSAGRNFRLTLSWNFNGGVKLNKNQIERSSGSEYNRLNEKE